MEKNQNGLTLAFKRARAKKLKIAELGIEPEMDIKEVDNLIVQLAQAKAIDLDVEWTTLIKGQRWYIESLIAFAGLSVQEQMDMEYATAIAEVASEAEMLHMLEQM